MKITRIVPAVLFSVALGYGQASKPLTSDDLIKMKTAGLDSQTIVKLIETNGTTVENSAESILSLKSAGIEDAVIRAVLSAPRSAPLSAPAAAPLGSGTIPEVGVYLEENGKLQPLPSEVPKSKSTSPLKIMATGGFGAVKTQGVLNGTKSSLQLTGPIVLVVRSSDGTSAETYQLVTLDIKKGSREFTTGKMSVFRGSSSGPADKDVTEIRFEKIGPNVFRASLTSLKRGEYGIYNSAGGAMAAMIKMYTFGVR